MGRPPKDPAHALSEKINVRFTAPEFAAIHAAAALHGLGLAAFLRRAALGYRLPPAVPAINRAAYAALARLAGNLNQWMHAINAGIAPSVPQPSLEELRRLLRLLRADLLGARRDSQD